MIEIDHIHDCMTISDAPYVYKRPEYEHLIGLLKSGHLLPRQILSVTATGKHLEAICEHINNIPKPNGLPKYGFVWMGDDAKTIVANICLALRSNVSVIVQTVDDYSFDWYNQ